MSQANSIGDLLKAWRKTAGLRQDEVATIARASGLEWGRDTVAAIEGGRRDLSLVEYLTLRGAPMQPQEIAALFHPRTGARPAPAAVAAKQDAELKAARKLGVDPTVIVTTARCLWGRTLTEERDARVKASIPIRGLVDVVDVRRARGFRDHERNRVLRKRGVITAARMVQARRGHMTRALVDELQQALQGTKQERKRR
jgi:hypothetical protein